MEELRKSSKNFRHNKGAPWRSLNQTTPPPSQKNETGITQKLFTVTQYGGFKQLLLMRPSNSNFYTQVN
jgi:hypothetical protein